MSTLANATPPPVLLRRLSCQNQPIPGGAEGGKTHRFYQSHAAQAQPGAGPSDGVPPNALIWQHFGQVVLGEQAFTGQAGNGIVFAAGFQQVGDPFSGGRAGRFIQSGLQHTSGL